MLKIKQGSWTRRTSAAFCLQLMLLCVLTSGSAPAQETQADPAPMFKVVREFGEDKVIDAIGAHPLGKVPVVLYKVADFGRELGVAATEREDVSLNANMILINADAALLKGMQARGLDTNHDPKAIAAKNRLRAMVQEMDSGDQNRWVHLGAVTMKHLPYAVAKVSLDKGISAGIGKLVKWAGPAIDKAVPIGDEVHDILGNRSALASSLRYVGWRKLGARADLAKKYTDELMHKLIQAKLDELVSAKLKEMFGSALDNLYKEVMEEHPSELRRTVISSPALYGPLVMQPVAALPAMAVPLPQPAVAVPIPAAPVAVAAPPPVIEQRRDPVANNLYVDDRYMRAMLRNSDRNSSRESSPPPAPPPPPEPPRQPTAREIELHHELMCVGAGNKPGCGSWDGGKGQTLRGR